MHILSRGSDTVITARAWQMLGRADSQPIPNVVFVWTSSDTAVATVNAAGHIVGIRSGTVIITAAAANFDKAAHAATDTLRVAAPLEIDSIRPKIVRYGELLSIYGVGVASIFVASLRGAQLIRVPYENTQVAGGTERSQWWVPFPARTDTLFFLGVSGTSGVFGYFHGDTTKVIEQDLYEPDDTVARPINLDAPPPFAAAPALVFYNPALAFEPLKRDQKAGADWYRFSHAQTQDLTIVLTAPQIAGTFLTYLSDSLGWDVTNHKYVLGADAWTFGPRSHTCHGKGFAPGEALSDSTIVAFKGLPAGTLDAIAIYGAPGRYGLRVVAGYQSELPPDAHEDDNSCNAADRFPIAIAPFRDTLAIENPHDVDWIKFRYTQGPLGSTAQVRMHALSGTHLDSLKDLDLYVVKIPQPADAAVQVLAADTSAGSDVDLRPGLATGDYYLAVVDFAGTATRYEVCVATIALLTPGPCAGAAFPSPPLGARPSRAARSVPAPALRLAPGRSP